MGKVCGSADHVGKGKNGRKRARLWAENPHCHWCGVLTTLGPRCETMATLDHLRPRHHPSRHEPARNGERRIVLACWKCNSTRDHAEMKSRWTLDELRARANRHPSKLRGSNA
jgi:hypothetical protein